MAEWIPFRLHPFIEESADFVKAMATISALDNWLVFDHIVLLLHKIALPKTPAELK